MMVVHLYSSDRSRDTLFILNYAKIEVTDVLSRFHGRHAGDCVVDQARRDLHDVAAALFHCELADVEEASEIDARRVVDLGVVGEWLGDEDAGVVYDRVDVAEPGHVFGRRARSSRRATPTSGRPRRSTRLYADIDVSALTLTSAPI